MIFFSECSQKKNPPENVKKEFSQKFADAKSVKWVSEEANEWEAEFKMNGKEMSACFDNAGKWLETEAEISAEELPSAVTNTLKNEFPGFKTGESSTIENPEMKGFEIALKSNEKEISVIISTDGTVIKKESGEENKEEAVNENEEKNENELKEADEEKEIQAPEKLLTVFNQKFPGATEVEWSKETANEWEAEFNMSGKKMSACFDSSAVWTETETAISENELPPAVSNTLKAEFAGYKANKIEIDETPEIKGFELGLEKGETSVSVIIDNAGKVIKKEVKGENEKEENEKEEK
jgi:Putative beta-lactamase-inhibitor-like, PepSY-like